MKYFFYNSVLIPRTLSKTRRTHVSRGKKAAKQLPISEMKFNFENLNFLVPTTESAEEFFLRVLVFFNLFHEKSGTTFNYRHGSSHS